MSTAREQAYGVKYKICQRPTTVANIPLFTLK